MISFKKLMGKEEKFYCLELYDLVETAVDRRAG